MFQRHSPCFISFMNVSWRFNVSRQFECFVAVTFTCGLIIYAVAWLGDDDDEEWCRLPYLTSSAFDFHVLSWTWCLHNTSVNLIAEKSTTVSDWCEVCSEHFLSVWKNGKHLHLQPATVINRTNSLQQQRSTEDSFAVDATQRTWCTSN